MGQAARRHAHRGGDRRSWASARRRRGGEGRRQALRPARARASDACMEGRETGEPPAGAGARGALPPARRPREGDWSRCAAHRASCRRSGGDGAVPTVARLWRRGSARYGRNDNARRHADRPAAHRPQKERPRRLRSSAKGPFVDDPSNADPRFARTRLRALLTRLGEEGLDAEALDRLARRARETEEALAHLTAEVETQLGSDGPGDARALFAAPIAIVQRVLARRIAAAGGRDPSRIGLEQIETLALSLREALSKRQPHSANLGGAVVRLTAKGRLSLAPEPPRKAAKR